MTDTTDLRMDPKDMRFYIRALLACGAQVEIFKRDQGSPWEFLVTPRPGTRVEDFLIVRDNNFHLHLDEDSALGVLQLMFMVGGKKLGFGLRHKKFLGIF